MGCVWCARQSFCLWRMFSVLRNWATLLSLISCSSCLQNMLWLASSLDSWALLPRLYTEEELAWGTEKSNLWLTQSVGSFMLLKNHGNFLSRGYSHTLDSCWQHRRNLRREWSQKWFFSCPSAPSKQTASAGAAAAFPCCGWRPVSVYFWWWRRLKQIEGLALLRFL